MTICDIFDVAVVPFPLVDPAFASPRPVLVLSARGFNAAAGHTVLAMITTGAGTSKAFDFQIRDPAAAGLPSPAIVRWKILTLENALIARRLGRLGAADRAALELLPWQAAVTAEQRDIA